MQRFFLRFVLFASLIACVFPSFVGAQPQDTLTEDNIDGESAILIDGATGTVLFAKNPDVPMYPASITKIATGIYAIENGNPDDIVTVSKRARNEEGTRVYLAEGEQVPLRKLEYGLLMNSGNDAATAIAEHLAGSNEAFAEKLNAFLKEKCGVTKTHFTNPHGLHDPNHYTTAADMAKIAQYAMRNPIFRQIVATKQYPWDGKEWKTVLVNHNQMLWRYEGATGIKNGYTDQARHTLVISAKRGGTELIAVTMKTKTKETAYQDCTRMLDYGFAHYETRQVARAGETFALATASTSERQDSLIVDRDLYVTVPLGEVIYSKVTPEGELVVIGPAGTIQTFALKRKELPAPGSIDSVGSGNGLPVGVQTARYGLFAFWMLLNLFLLGFAVRKTARRRSISEQRLHKRAHSELN